jgi:K+-sensing histidine kinase KdpD
MHQNKASRRGCLKVFLGAAPGVGKTYAMLQEARAKRQRGIEVVIGLVETHGRQDTEGLLRDMEVIPRKQIEYKGNVFEELDVDAVLERQPALAVVDELAHTNVPGSRNRKRYLDVQELITAGIDVFTTLNVQHIEGLADAVSKITWAGVHESVPDDILDAANEVEVIDLSPADLIERLKEGKVAHLGARVPMGRFFSERNLAGLRDLALQLAKKPPVRRILIPFDGSPAAIRAVQHVVCLARAGHQGTVLLVNAQNYATHASHESTEAAPEPMFDKASRLLEVQHIPYRCELLFGKPSQAIVAVVERDRIDLVVMGTTGIGMARLLLGSVAMAVASHSKVPVTLVN